MKGYKLNMDGYFIGNTEIGGTGGIIRDGKGDWIIGFSGNLYSTDIIKAELMALLQGRKLAWKKNLSPLEISTDCKDILGLLANDHPIYTNILSDCRELMQKLGNPQSFHIFKETNQVADALAREGTILTQPNSFLYCEVPPVFVLKKLEAELRNFFVKIIRSQTAFCHSSNVLVSRDKGSRDSSASYVCNSPPIKLPPPPDNVSRPVLPLLCTSNIYIYICLNHSLCLIFQL